MQIPRSYIENYSDSLNLISEKAKKELADALARIDYTADIATIRNAVIAAMEYACSASTEVASRLAAEFYDGLRRRFGIVDDYKAEVKSFRDPDATDGAVRAFVQYIVEDEPPESFIELCTDRLDYETRKAANESVAYNARKDPKEPRWARVPTGIETCEFCQMLASRGFVYHSEETASHAHANCDCRIVPSWDRDRPGVQGYNPEHYFDEWTKSGFRPGSKSKHREAKDLGRGGKFADTGINGMNDYLRASKTLDELYKRADEVLTDIKERWNGDSSMIKSASKTAKEMRKKLSK